MKKQETIKYVNDRIGLEKCYYPEGFTLTIDCSNFEYKASDLAGFLVISRDLDAQAYDDKLIINHYPKKDADDL